MIIHINFLTLSCTRYSFIDTKFFAICLDRQKSHRESRLDSQQDSWRDFSGSPSVSPESRIGLYAWLSARLSPRLVFLRGLLYSEMNILSNWTMYHVPSATILAVGTRFLSTTNQYFATNFFLVESTKIHFSQCSFKFKNAKIVCLLFFIFATRGMSAVHLLKELYAPSTKDVKII